MKLELFRVFPYGGQLPPLYEALPFLPNTSLQGNGRHDNPERYAALYCSQSPISAIAESIQNFKGRTFTAVDLERAEGSRLHLARFELRLDAPLIDLDDPHVLSEYSARPSLVATSMRAVTQPRADRIHRTGALGILWWSTIESLWINATLYIERVENRLTLLDKPSPLNIKGSIFQEAAGRAGILL